MNANVLRGPSEPRPTRLTIPEAALGRLRLRLGREVAIGETLDASQAHGVSCDTLGQLVDVWRYDFELEQQPLHGLPTFSTELDGASWSFVHARSTEPGAIPLLLMHGYSGSPSEMAGIIEPLRSVEANHASSGDAFHVVCPALPGFGLSEGGASSHTIAAGCAALMARLGYDRYVVHGSDLGATLALALAELDREHVAGVHVTALPAYPRENAEEMASLSAPEKSQLALLSQVRDELALALPASPIEALAFALARLEEPERAVTNVPLRDSLLLSLTLSWALGGFDQRNELYRRTRLAPAAASGRPIAVSAFPLDAPSLRRFAEQRHRVVEWTEHEHGGPMPALEQPELLVASLRAFFRRFR